VYFYLKYAIIQIEDETLGKRENEMTKQYEIREDPSNKYWSFQVFNLTDGWMVDRFPTREEAQKRIDQLTTPIDHENSVAWKAISDAEEAWEHRFSKPLPEPEQPALPDEIELLNQETVGTIIEYRGAQWLVTACYYLTERDVIDIEDVNDVSLSVGWHSHLVKVQPGDKLLLTLAELVQTGEARFTSATTVLFADEEYATPLDDLAYSDELGIYKKSRIKP